MQSLKEFPYLQYQHNSTKNPREEHKAWDGKIIARDDPWWQTHYPPNGWGCRCSVTGVSEARLRALGKTAPDAAPPAVPGDPPPEWAYHVGEANSGKFISDKALAKELDQKWDALPARTYESYQRPDTLPIDVPKAVPLPAAIRDPQSVRAAWDTLYGQATILRDPSGAEVHLTRQVIDHWLEASKRLDGRERYLPLLKETVEEPFEIWASFAHNHLGKVGIRRYYVKRIEVIDSGKRTILTVIAEVLPGGVWGSFDFFQGKSSRRASRAGLLVYGRAP